MANKCENCGKETSGLKTLEDIGVCGCCEVEDQQEYGCMKPELRKQAIEWILAIKKVQEKGDTCLREHGKIREDFEVCIYDYEQDDSAPMINWIKYFFNITEAELDALVSGGVE